MGLSIEEMQSLTATAKREKEGQAAQIDMEGQIDEDFMRSVSMKSAASPGEPAPENLPRGLDVNVTALPTPAPPHVPGWGEKFEHDAFEAGTKPYEDERLATRAGVAVDDPAPVGHALASFAYDDAEKVEAYRQRLSAKLGGDAVVEVGPKTGQIEWLNPETGRFALANPPRGNMSGKITGAAGGSVVAMPELVGAGVMALATKSPAAAALGGGFGATVGELARLYTGKALGINQSMTDEQAADSAAKVGGVSTATGLALNGVVALGQFIKHAVSGNAVSFAKKFGDELGMSMEDAAKVQTEINQTIQAERLRLANAGELPDTLHDYRMTLGQATGNKNQLSLEEFYRRSPEYQGQFGDFNEQSQLALKDFYNILSQPFERASITPTEAARLTSLRATRALKSAETRATEHLSRYEADAANALASVDTLPTRQLGDVMQGVSDTESAAFKERADALVTKISDLAGNKPFIVNEQTASVFNSLDDKARNIVIPGLKAQAKSSQMLPPKTESTEAINPFTGETYDETTLGALYDGSHKWTLAQSWSTLSRLKQVVRDGSYSDIDKGALRKIIGAMEGDLQASAENSAIGSTYRDFADWYRTEKGRLNSGVIDKVLDADGRLKEGGAVFAKVFPATNARAGGGMQQTAEFMDLIKSDPQAISSFRRAIADDWREYSVESGRVNPARSAQWFRMHQDQFGLTFQGARADERKALGELNLVTPKNVGEPLFTPDEMGQIRKAESFEGVLAVRETRTKNALEAVNKSINGKLSDLNTPDQLVGLVRSDPDGVMAGKVMRNLKGAVDVSRGLQNAYLKDMRAKVITTKIPGSTDKQFSPTALKTFLDGPGDGNTRGQREVIKQIFGPRYVAGLDTLLAGVERSSLEAANPNRPNTAWWQGKVANVLSRMYFGQLSHERTAIGGAKELYSMAANRALAKAVLTPEDMHRLMGVWNKDFKSRRTQVVLGQLGLGPVDFENE